MIAEFTLANGSPVTINMAQIDYFSRVMTARSLCSAGRQLELQESYDAVAEVLNPERQSGF